MLNGYYEGMDVSDALSRIFVWLRYSATRQLTWQRNYNTQPRILSAAQERLTNTIANAHGRTTGGSRHAVLILSSHGVLELARISDAPTETPNSVRAHHTHKKRWPGMDHILQPM